MIAKLEGINLSIGQRSPAAEQINIPEVQKAVNFAALYHAKQKRKTGEPFYSHPLEVANMVADYLPAYRCMNRITVLDDKRAPLAQAAE